MKSTQHLQAGTLLLAGLLTAACSPQAGDQPTPQEHARIRLEPDEVLVSVHGSELTYGAAIRQVKRRLGGPPPERMDPAKVAYIERSTFQSVVDAFIRRELLLHEAQRLGIEPAPDDVAFALQTIREKSTNKEQPPSGMVYEGPDSLRREVYTGLQIEKLLSQELGASIAPSDDEVEARLASPEGPPMQAAQARIRRILVEIPFDASEADIQAAHQRAAEARQALLDGADFAEWARMMSEGPAAEKGGELGIVEQGRGEPVLDEAVFSQETGAIGPILRTPSGFHIIQVLERRPARARTRQEIRASLQREKRAAALGTYVYELRKKADIKHSPALQPIPEASGASR